MEISNKELVNIEIKNYLQSEVYKNCIDAKNYYQNKNDIINNKKRYYVENGVRREINTLANNIIANPIFRELVDQKINYLLSNDWDINNEDLSILFDDSFRIDLNRAGYDAVKYGLGWLFANPDYKFKYVDGFKIIPIWEDSTHTNLLKLIRMYKKLEYINGKKQEVEYAELWTTEGVFTFKKENGKEEYEQIDEKIIGHIKKIEKDSITGEEKESYENWKQIPFIYIKYNQDELPLISLVKSLIDSMDKTASDTQDLLSDLTNKITVVSGATGTDPEEISTNKRLYRTIVLPDDANYNEVGTDPDITAAKTWLEYLRSQIYIAGRGYDPLQAIGANASGEARRNLYTNLDLDVNQLEIGVLEALKRCIWFINNAPKSKYSIPEDVKIKFTRNMLVNQGEQIRNARDAQGIKGLSVETIVGMTGLVENVQEEIKKAKDEELSELKDQADIFNTNDNKPFVNNTNKK